ncbi:MAG: Flp pilus assembly protein CpaB [Candidatus Omnitrophica bacterium]|nr:Flp pilus assembly protein CpaB [Candidatus Omnitrophota bacterium]
MFQPNPEFKKKLLIVIAIACGILAAVLARMYIAEKELKLKTEIEAVKKREEAERLARQVKKVAILVAARTISPGVPIVAEDIASREVPEDYIQPGAIASTINIVGVYAQSQILEGEQILRNKLGAPPEKPKIISEITPRGKRAVSVLVDNIASLQGLLQPGDYVDALAIISPPPGSTIDAIVNRTPRGQTEKQEKKSVTVPLFQNVLVLAIGSDTGGAHIEQPKGKGTSAAANAVTLSLTPQEAALASFIQEQGKIKLVTRSNSDLSQTEVDPVNWDNLFEYLYPKAREEGKMPVTVEVYRGLQKEVIPLISEGKKK